VEIILAILVEWLSLNTDINIKAPPEVVVKTSEELIRIYGAPVHALYSHEAGTIYLSDHVDMGSIQGASVLLHELIHHYQNTSGAMDGYSCIRQSEKLAYELQREYLEKNNAEIMPELSAFNILMRSICTEADT
jgi:hypothetical protein